MQHHTHTHTHTNNLYLNGIECLWKDTQEMENRIVSGQSSQELRARDQRKTYFLPYIFWEIIIMCMYYLSKILSNHLKI